jgi:O-Antigen ligase
LNALINQELPRRIAPLALGALGALLVGYAVTSPTNVIVPLALYGGIAIAIAMVLPPHVFLAVALLVVGVSTGFSSVVVSVGPAALYVSDLVVLVIFLRGFYPRARRPGSRALGGVPQTLFVVWMFVMAVAGVRGILAGIPIASVVRSDLALFYWPLLYFGFTRVLSEVSVDMRLLWRNLAFVTVGFAVYMFIARGLNHQFQDPGLALVPTGPTESIPRNFGFASAFTIYPMLAIAAVAVLAHSRDNRLRWTLLASIGVIATLTTLVRGEIFSLGLGILLVLWLSPRQRWATGRAGATLRLALAAGVTVLAVLAVDPKLGHAVIQRALPFTHQAADATKTADYRFKAMDAGIREARAHPLGVGALDQQALFERNIDPGYLAHSGFATLLIFGGWIALAASILTLVAVVRRSFQAPRVSRWLHPAFVGAITMLSVYSLGAAGLAGDSWVVPLGALVVALRFGLHPER